MTNELEIASAEITEIFKLLPDEEVNKVPIKLRNYFNSMAKTEYNVNIDPNKRLLEQNISEKTKDIITLLYRNYWCTPEKRKELDQTLIQNEKNFQNALKEKYNPDNIFKNENNKENKILNEQIKPNNLTVNTINTQNQQTALVETKESIFKKIWSKIKNIFVHKK